MPLPLRRGLGHTDSVVRIEEYAFYTCYGLKNVTLPSGLREIGDYSFSYCYQLTNVSLPEGLTTVGSSAFYSCSLLGSIDVSSSVAFIGESAFEACTSLEAIEVDDANPNYASVSGVLYDKQRTTLLQCPAGKTGPITLIEGTRYIDDGAFYQCSKVTSIYFPAGVEGVGDYAFQGCSLLEKVVLPSSLKEIGYAAFRDCTSLVAIEVNATNLNYASFDGVLFDKNMRTLLQCPGGKDGAFSIPSGVTTIEDYGLYRCNLTSVIVPSSVSSIHYRSFDNMMSLTTLHFLGDAPQCDNWWIDDRNDSLVVYYAQGSQGFTSPTWYDIESMALVTLSGKVVDGKGVGIPGIQVTLDGSLWVMTDTNGNYTMLASAGKHVINFSGTGFKNRTMEVTVTETNLTMEDVEMDPVEGDDDGDPNNAWMAIAVLATIIVVVAGVLGFLWWRKNRM